MWQYLPMMLQLVGAGTNLYDTFAGGQRQPQAPPTLSYNEALSRAEDSLNPVYDKYLKDSLNQVDNANISRGFYGQLPGDVLARSTAADVQGQRAGQIANLAQQMTAQSEANALAQQQLAMQWAAQQQGARQQGLVNVMNTAGNLLGMQMNTAGMMGGPPQWMARFSGYQGAPLLANPISRTGMGAISQDTWNKLLQGGGQQEDIPSWFGQNLQGQPNPGPWKQQGASLKYNSNDGFKTKVW